MYYFLLDESTIAFAASVNNGVRPQIHDESGRIQFFIMHTDGRPNDIVNGEDAMVLELVKNGILIIFAEVM